MTWSYETYAERDGVKYEIVKAGTNMWGEQLYLACTLQEVMRPSLERSTLGTFTSRAEAARCLDQTIPPDHEQRIGEVKP